MFSDPIATTYGATVTIGVAGGSAKSLPRIGNESDGATYRLEEAGNVETTLNLSHGDLDKKPRVVARLSRSSLIADPLLSGQNRPAVATVTITMAWDANLASSEVQALYAQLLTFLTPANALRLLGGES